MYEELVKRLRTECTLPQSAIKDMREAADAIEELRKAVLRLEDESGIYDELPTFWILNKDGSRTCSECGHNGTSYGKQNFCPNCGAKMELEDDN